MLELCPRCAFRFERRPGHFVGAVGMNTIVVFAAGLVALVTGFILTAPDIAVGPLVVIGLAIALLGPVLFYPFSKTTWAAIDLIFTPLDEEEAPGRR